VLILILAALPFGEVLVVPVGVALLTAFEVLYLLLIALLILRVLFVGFTRRFLPFVFFAYTFAFYGVASLFFLSNPTPEAITQGRNYLPYIVATLLLLAGTALSPRSILLGLAVAAFFSSLSSLYIQHFEQDFLREAFSGNEFIIALTTQEGRMYWANASLVYFAWLAFIHLEKRKPAARVLVALAVLGSTLGLFNTMQRSQIAGLAVLLVAVLIPLGNIRLKSSRVFRVIPLILISVSTVYVLIILDERVQRLTFERFLGYGRGISGIYESDFIEGRVPLYDQYLAIVTHYFPLGQGLGAPLSSTLMGDVYTSDISALSFLLTFGLLGLICFFAFLVSLFRAVNGRANSPRSLHRSMLILLLVSILMSFNIDMFVRDNFAVFFVLLASSASSHKMAQEREFYRTLAFVKQRELG
jgi:hypothetical protein